MYMAEGCLAAAMDFVATHHDARRQRYGKQFLLDDYPIAGATVKEFDKTTSNFNASTGVLTLNFVDATTIQAGTPYIIKWDETIAENFSNPVFLGVTVEERSKSECAVTTNDGNVAFQGIFDPFPIAQEDKTVLYLVDADNLYYPNGAMTIGSCRAYFQLLNGLTAGESADPNTPAKARVIVLNLSDGEQTGIHDLSVDAAASHEPGISNSLQRAWYTLDGRKLDGKPYVKGMYIKNGRKVVVE